MFKYPRSWSRLQLFAWVMDKTKRCSEVILCVAVYEAVSVHAQCNITVHVFWPHFLHHAPRWTHVTLLLGAVAQPARVVACVQSVEVVRSKARLPTGLDGPGSWPANASKGKSKFSMWDFLPNIWRQKDVTVENCQVQQLEKELICPLPCLMGSHVAIGHPISLVNIAHMTVANCHKCQL